MPDGTAHERTKGTSQEGIFCPLLANLFPYYIFDKWMATYHRNKPFVRNADDTVVNCRSKEDADKLRSSWKMFIQIWS
jgi:RNA-directed DNA polymerase